MREATLDDVPMILGMAKDHYVENVPKCFVFNDQMASDYIAACIKAGAIFYVSENGFIFGATIETWWGENRGVYGPTCYIRPQARNGFTVKSFLNAFMKAAEQREKYVYADTYNHGIAFDGFLTVMGFNEVGKLYLKEF
jgi:hypothetical protein